MNRLLPSVEHKMCVRHMYNNFKKDYLGLVLMDKIWVAPRASYVNRFSFLLEDLVEHASPKEWTRSHLSNLYESFIFTILDVRERPILWIFETIRFYLIVRMEKKIEWMRKYTGNAHPMILKMLEKSKKTQMHASLHLQQTKKIWDKMYAWGLIYCELCDMVYVWGLICYWSYCKIM